MLYCKKCHKEISVDDARHCTACGSDYCADCAQSLCDCTEELQWYN